MTKALAANAHTHYEVLGLRSSTAEGPHTTPDIKAAYRRALLQHHPDKGMTTNDLKATESRGPKHTVDQVILAYKILAKPDSRAEYDRHLLLQRGSGLKADSGEAETLFSYTGLDTVDLDDMRYDDEHNVWFRGCRCGNTKGFLVTEQELEEAAEEGIIAVGCRGCSLWLMVLFQAVTDDGHDEDKAAS